MSSSILPNYIYDNILEYIIYYIYNNEYINNIHSKASYYKVSNNNEVITYALVNKKWFSLVCQTLPRYINERNYDTLSYLMESPPQQDQQVQQQQQQQQSKFKLIKLSDVIKHYNSVEEYEKDLKSNLISHFKRVTVSVDYNETENLLTYINKYPDNTQFKLFNEIDNFINHFNIRKNDSSIMGKIKELEVGSQSMNQIIQLLNLQLRGLSYYYSFYSTQPIILDFNSNESSQINITDLILYKPTQEEQSSSQDNNNNISSSSNYNISPSSSSQLSKLHITFDVVKFIESMFSDGLNEDQIKIRWNEITDRLSNDKTLTRLFVAHYCTGSCSCGPIKPIKDDLLYSGYKSIISKTTSIKTFGIATFDKAHDDIVQGLVENKSIINLITLNRNLAHVIKNVLTKNKTIQNLFVQSYSSSDNIDLIIQGLQLLSDLNIQLYNLTLIFNEIHLNSVLDHINNSNIQLSVKEILLDATSTTIKTQSDEEDSTIFYRFNNKNNHINNNIIINIFTNQRKKIIN